MHTHTLHWSREEAQQFAKVVGHYVPMKRQKYKYNDHTNTLPGDDCE